MGLLDNAYYPDWKKELIHIFRKILEYREHFPEELVSDHELTRIVNLIVNTRDQSHPTLVKIGIIYRVMYSYLVAKGVCDPIYEDNILSQKTDWDSEYEIFSQQYADLYEKTNK